MRNTGLVALFLTVIVATAHGKPLPAQIPDQCRTWADDADHARTEQRRLGAELSLASCLLEDRVGALTLTGDDGSIKALGRAIEPAIAILDQIAAGSDPAYQILAAHAKGDLYDGLVVRMRNTGRSSLEAQLAPWSQAAAAAYGDAVRIAKTHPDLVDSNPVVASAVRSCESRLQERRR
jgi:hypothetical protein